MQAALAKQNVHNLIESLPTALLHEVTLLIELIKLRDEQKQFKALEAASVSSMSFWDNEIDDEVWNDV